MATKCVKQHLQPQMFPSPGHFVSQGCVHDTISHYRRHLSLYTGKRRTWKTTTKEEPPSHCSSPPLQLSFSVHKPRNPLFGKTAIATARNPQSVLKMPLPERRKNKNSSVPEDLYSCGDMLRRPEATKGWLKISHIHFVSSRRCSNICQDLVHQQTLFAASCLWHVSVPPLCLTSPQRKWRLARLSATAAIFHIVTQVGHECSHPRVRKTKWNMEMDLVLPQTTTSARGAGAKPRLLVHALCSGRCGKAGSPNSNVSLLPVKSEGLAVSSFVNHIRYSLHYVNAKWLIPQRIF